MEKDMVLSEQLRAVLLDVVGEPERESLLGLREEVYSEGGAVVTRFAVYTRVKLGSDSFIIAKHTMPDDDLRRTLCVTYFNVENAPQPVTLLMVAQDTGEVYDREGKPLGSVVCPGTAGELGQAFVGLLNNVFFNQNGGV